MAISDTLLQQARFLSSKALQGDKWDTEAFIVVSLIELLSDKVEIVPEEHRQIDDKLKHYCDNPCCHTLDEYLTQEKQKISELWNDGDDERQTHILKFISDLSEITRK